MTAAEFFSKRSTFSGDYDGILRNPQNEFSQKIHYHDFYELVIYLGNAGVFQIGENEYLVRRGDLVLIDMFKPHVLHRRGNNNYERFSMCLDLNLAIAFSTEQSNLLDIFLNDNHAPIYHLTEEQLAKYILLIQQYQDVKLNNGQDILSKALVHQIIAYAYNDCYRGSVVNKQENQHMQIVSQMLNYINDHMAEEISLADLAAEVNYSEYYICRLFKKITGKTLTNYIQEKRIESAACLLRSGMSINLAAEQVGFNNYSYFYKTFKKFMNSSPAEYQARFRPQSDSPENTPNS